jgi:Protein of unknown function (DUF3035)
LVLISFLKRPSFILFVASAAGALALAGCSGTWTDVKRGLGMEKVIPDEFAVTSEAPLAVPPDFSLRPPQPGAPPTQLQAPVVQARETVFRASDNKLETLQSGSGSFSPGEDELLKQAGAQAAPANIRQLVTSDGKKGADTASFTDKLLFWKSTPKEAPANQVIDPNYEAERLRQASGAASPDGATTTATAAATPTPAAPAVTGATGQPRIEHTQDKSFWNWLF